VKSSQRIAALTLVKTELEAWLSYQPSWHFKLHGCKDANIAYQQLKTLIQWEMDNLVVDTELDVDDNDTLDQSLGLHNDK